MKVVMSSYKQATAQTPLTGFLWYVYFNPDWTLLASDLMQKESLILRLLELTSQFLIVLIDTVLLISEHKHVTELGQVVLQIVPWLLRKAA